MSSSLFARGVMMSDSMLPTGAVAPPAEIGCARRLVLDLHLGAEMLREFSHRVTVVQKDR
jgi:hypothetical protein